MVRGNWGGGGGFWTVNTWRAPAWKRLKRSNVIISWRRSLSYIDFVCKPMDWFWHDRGFRHERVKLYKHISNRVLNKNMPVFFLTMSHAFLIAIIRWVLKAYFAWKQLKTDYAKNIWKEENHGHGFVYPLVGYISAQINFWKLQFCW